MRKVEPLKAALGGYEAWVTGIRRDEGPTRADTPLVTFDEQFGLVKVNPLAAWTFDEVVDYANDHRVPVNLLLSDGYPSIGCEPCTQRVAARRRPARRALGRLRQDRVRSAPMSGTPRSSAHARVPRSAWARGTRPASLLQILREDPS